MAAGSREKHSPGIDQRRHRRLGHGVPDRGGVPFREGLDARGLTQTPEQDLAAMDDVNKIPQLQEVGRAFAERYVLLEHLSVFI